jgi:hypothetical protein
LKFADFNNQGPFNNFSGDYGTFAGKTASIETSFDTHVFHGPNGASLRLDYAVPSGFCGMWHSLIGKASYPRYSLNFTNLYAPLLNSMGNPSRVEGVRVTNFSFWARGNGIGKFEHKLKVEFKSGQKLAGSAVFSVPNGTRWVRCDFPMADLNGADLSQMKQVVFVIEDWKNDNRSGQIYLDDLAFTTDEATYDPGNWKEDAALDLISQRVFWYFLIFTDDLGFALDRSTYSDMVSVGTIGFQLTAYCIGHQRGWADRTELENRVVTILQNLESLPMGPEPGTSRGGYRGFYYHFLNANVGTRKDNHVELSLYDTMLLMYGVLTCKQYFVTNAQIQALSKELFDRVEWNWFVDHSPGINTNRFYLAWLPGPVANGSFPGTENEKKGTFFKHVDGQTDEALMVDVLALGSKTYPVSFESYIARNRVYGSYPPGDPARIMVSWRGSMFNYFFASCWLDFQNRGLDLHPESPCNIWRNDKLAIIANRQFCLDHASRRSGGSDGRYATYGVAAWGLTACDNLTPPLAGTPSEYFSFGALPNEEEIRFGTKALQAGTIAVYGALSSINYLPQAALTAMQGYLRIPGLWSPLFGFGDAFSSDPHYLSPPYDSTGNPTGHFADYLNGPWVNHMVMGINAGPMLLAIENYRSRFIWKLTAGNPEMQTGLDRIFGIGTPEKAVVSVTHNGDQHFVNLQWQPELGASEYNIYGSNDMETWTLCQAGIKGTAWAGPASGTGPQRYYEVKAIR